MEKKNLTITLKVDILFYMGSEYSSQRFLNKHGYLGRSHGCPSVDNKISKKIINAIKEGSLHICLQLKKNNSTITFLSFVIS